MCICNRLRRHAGSCRWRAQQPLSHVHRLDRSEAKHGGAMWKKMRNMLGFMVIARMIARLDRGEDLRRALKFDPQHTVRVLLGTLPDTPIRTGQSPYALGPVVHLFLPPRFRSFHHARANKTRTKEHSTRWHFYHVHTRAATGCGPFSSSSTPDCRRDGTFSISVKGSRKSVRKRPLA